MDELVYVEVLDAPEYSLACVIARRLHGDCFCLLNGSEDPEHCVYAFEQGEFVRCERRDFAPGEVGLVAVAPCRCGASWETVTGAEAVNRVLQTSPGTLRLVGLSEHRLLMELWRWKRDPPDTLFLVAVGVDSMKGKWHLREAALFAECEEHGCRLWDAENEFELRCWTIGAGWGPGMAENLHWIAHPSETRR